jgi:hypothetical protein
MSYHYRARSSGTLIPSQRQHFNGTGHGLPREPADGLTLKFKLSQTIGRRSYK